MFNKKRENFQNIVRELNSKRKNGVTRCLITLIIYFDDRSLQPWLIWWIHAAQVVWIACKLNKLRHFVAIVVVEVCERRQSLNYLICAFVDDLNDVFDVNLAEAFVLR